VNLQRKAWLCAIILAAFAFFLLPSSASAPTRSAAESFEGQWLTDGYGGFIELQSDTLRRYEITKTGMFQTFCFGALTRGQSRAASLSPIPHSRIIKSSGRHSPNTILSLLCAIWIGSQWIRNFARR
jgi:hypothetical protein